MSSDEQDRNARLQWRRAVPRRHPPRLRQPRLRERLRGDGRQPARQQAPRHPATEPPPAAAGDPWQEAEKE